MIIFPTRKLTKEEIASLEMAAQIVEVAAGEAAHEIFGYSGRRLPRKEAMRRLKDWGYEEHSACIDSLDQAGSLGDMIYSDADYCTDLALDRLPNGIWNDCAGRNACCEWFASRFNHVAKAFLDKRHLPESH
jgi:hypothetical protein